MENPSRCERSSAMRVVRSLGSSKEMGTIRPLRRVGRRLTEIDGIFPSISGQLGGKTSWCQLPAAGNARQRNAPGGPRPPRKTTFSQQNQNNGLRRALNARTVSLDLRYCATICHESFCFMNVQSSRPETTLVSTPRCCFSAAMMCRVLRWRGVCR